MRTVPKKDYKPWTPEHARAWYANEEYPMAETMLRVMAWVLRGRCKVIDRDDPAQPVPLRMRAGQVEVFRRALKQAKARKPIRIIVPKYRRHGISTICQAIGLGIARICPYRNCRTVAHKEDGSTAIFNIARIMWEQDGQKGGRGKAKEIKPPEMKSSYQCMTGAGHFTSSGDTIHFLHVSELAKFPNTSEQDQRALNSMLNAVSQTSPQSMIVLESSGQGPDGVFPERCRAAYSGKSTYECVFLPWTMDSSLVIDEDELPDEFDPPLFGDEITLKDTYKASDGQLAWRRQKLDDDFPGTAYGETPPAFAWDYPTTLEDCFGQKSGRIYPGFDRKKHVGVVNENELSDKAYKTRFIDWGGSENHAFVCLWVTVDPEKPPQLIVNEECVHFIAEHEKYARDAKTGKPLKSDDHTCDAFRDGVTTLSVKCMCYVYRELYVTDPSQAGHTQLPRRIHQMSGWVHPSGDPNHPDIAKYEPGPNADMFAFGGDENDARFDFGDKYGDDGFGEKMRNAMRMGAGVADAAQYRHCMDYTDWGIPLIPHVKPPGPTKAGFVEDGIAWVQVLIAGDTSYRRDKPPSTKDLAVSGADKLRRHRAVLPTDEEIEAMKRDRGIIPFADEYDDEFDEQAIRV